MGVLKKMKKQWYRINKNNYESIRQEKERQEIVMWFKKLNDFFNTKHEAK